MLTNGHKVLTNGSSAHDLKEAAKKVSCIKVIFKILFVRLKFALFSSYFVKD
jgi:hypothetical protein